MVLEKHIEYFITSDNNVYKLTEAITEDINEVGEEEYYLDKKIIDFFKNKDDMFGKARNGYYNGTPIWILSNLTYFGNCALNTKRKKYMYIYKHAFEEFFEGKRIKLSENNEGVKLEVLK